MGEGVSKKTKKIPTSFMDGPMLAFFKYLLVIIQPLIINLHELRINLVDVENELRGALTLKKSI